MIWVSIEQWMRIPADKRDGYAIDITKSDDDRLPPRLNPNRGEFEEYEGEAAARRVDQRGFNIDDGENR